MSEFPLLSDERIEAQAVSIWGEMRGGPMITRCAFARAIESESRAPLLAEIERLKADAQARDAAMVEAVFKAVLSCPHVIEGDAVELQYSHKAEGHNALNQLHRRISAAIDAARAQGGEE